MPKITAKGIFSGKECIVEVFPEAGSLHIKVDGEYDEAVQNHFNHLLKKVPVMGGTYYPPENSMLAAYGVLESTFFDAGSTVNLKVDGNIGKIPTYDINGIVY